MRKLLLSALLAAAATLFAGLPALADSTGPGW